MNDFKLSVFDDEKTIFFGSAMQFLRENENDEEVKKSLELCEEYGISNFGGGSMPIYEFIREEKENIISELAKRIDDFIYNYDYYSYINASDSREKSLNDLKDSLKSDFEVKQITDMFKEYISVEEDENHIQKMKQFIKELNEL